MDDGVTAGSEVHRGTRAPHQVPAPPSPLIGRSAEVPTILAALAEHRLVTLTGSGGVGKTRLAVHVANLLEGRYEGGVWWIDLAGVRDASAIAPGIVAALGLNDEGLRASLDTARDRLATAPALLVLDNCEHLVAATSAVVDALTSACGELTVLTTSRESLGLPGEVVWPVPSMAVPPSAPPIAPADALGYDAVALFVDRARRVRPDWAIDDGQLAALVEVCRRLDGIPLAIELAAARCRQLSPDQILDDLGQRFRLLTGGARTVLARHQTLLASVEWSHDLLDADERSMLRRLGVFAGPFPLDAAEAVAASFGDVDRWAVLDLVGRLVDKSLLQIDQHTDASGRTTTQYRMLETVRQYAVERAREAGELGPARDAHADWWTEALQRAGGRWPRALAVQLADRHAPDIRAALDWLDDDPERRHRLLSLVAMSWHLTGRADDGLHYAERWLIGGPSAGHESSWAAAYAALGITIANAYRLPLLRWARQAFDVSLADGNALGALRLAYPLMWDLPNAAAVSGDAIELCLDRDPDALFANAAMIFPNALAVLRCGDRARGQRLTDRVAALAAEDPARARWWRSLTTRGWSQPENPLARMSQGGDLDNSEAVEDPTMGSDFARANQAGVRLVGVAVHGRTDGAGPELEFLAGHRHVPLVWSWFLAGRGFCRLVDGVELTERDLWGLSNGFSLSVPPMRYYGVRALLSVDAADQAGPMIAGLPGPGVARVASAIVQAVLALRDDRVLDAAREVATAAVAEVDDSWDDVRPDVLELAAVVASRCQDHQRALVLAGAAEHCRERNGVAYRWRDQQRWLDDALAGATAQLGADETGAALARGAVLDIDEAMGIVRRGAGERRRPASGWDSLTPAEHQVCDLLADGLTNPQIAERLLMSRATVKTHISHCLTKLGMSTRSEIAAEVVRRGR